MFQLRESALNKKRNEENTHIKKFIALLLALAMVLSLAACGKKEAASAAQDNKDLYSAHLQEDGQIEMGLEGVEVEVNVSDIHLDSFEASTSGNWEAMFTPVVVDGRAIDMADIDLTPTAEELEAMKNEPAYGKPLRFFMGDGCTAGTVVAEAQGFYTAAGFTATEGFKSTSYTEGLGTAQVDIAIGHIATMLVPITNGVDLTFVGGAHIGCKSLYVLADSPYNTTEDLKGTPVSVPSGIGSSDYNITCMMLDEDDINPQTDLELIQVTADACINAMENGEISAALLSDTFAYAMVKDGKLKCIRSLLDEDFSTKNCCVIAMNGTYVKENPVHAKKAVQAIQKAHSFMRDKGAEATQYLLDNGWNKGDFDMNVMINNSLQFGTADKFTEDGLRDIVESYVKLGLIKNMDNVDEIMALAWSPVLD